METGLIKKCHHEKIKFVSPRGRVMFCLFHRYRWNFHIKHIDVKIWQLTDKVTGNCNVSAPQSHFVNEISKELAVRLIGKLSCNWLNMLVTMAKPISSHVKYKNSIFTTCDEGDVGFISKKKNPGIASVSI